MLEVRPLENINYELIKKAEKVIEKNYRYERHHIGSAVRTKTGKIYSAVHIEANVGRITVCAKRWLLVSLYLRETMNLKRLSQ